MSSASPNELITSFRLTFSCLISYRHCDIPLHPRTECRVFHWLALRDRGDSLNSVRAPLTRCIQGIADSRRERGMEGWGLGRTDSVSFPVLFVFVRHAHPPVPLCFCDIGSSVLLGAAERNAVRRAVWNVTLTAAELMAQPDYDALLGEH